jgi:hypothetical protein
MEQKGIRSPVWEVKIKTDEWRRVIEVIVMNKCRRFAIGRVVGKLTFAS